MQAKQSTLGILTGNPAKDEQSQQSTIDGQESSTISKDNDKELEINCTDRNLFVVLSGGADVSHVTQMGTTLALACTGTSLVYSFRNSSIRLTNPLTTSDAEGAYFVSRADQLISHGAAKSIDGCNNFGQQPCM